MIGAIIGDYVGSAYEFANTKDYNFQLITPESDITDDSIMSIAIAHAICEGKSYESSMRYWGNKYPNPKGSYGGSFGAWLRSENPQPYNSWGNGAAMRVSAIGWAFETLEEVQREAQRSAMCTHNHSEGIKGAMAVASAIYFVRMGKSKEELKQYIETNFGYNLSRKTADIRPTYQFNESCQGTVPEAIICYLESSCFVDAIRLAVSLGGDSDTLACITGSIAEAESSCAIPTELLKATLTSLPTELRNELSKFIYTYRCNVGNLSMY